MACIARNALRTARDMERPLDGRTYRPPAYRAKSIAGFTSAKRYGGVDIAIYLMLGWPPNKQRHRVRRDVGADALARARDTAVRASGRAAYLCARRTLLLILSDKDQYTCIFESRNSGKIEDAVRMRWVDGPLRVKENVLCSASQVLDEGVRMCTAVRLHGPERQFHSKPRVPLATVSLTGRPVFRS